MENEEVPLTKSLTLGFNLLIKLFIYIKRKELLILNPVVHLHLKIFNLQFGC